jgi:GNAT superfamily N-acetyltransferase
MEIRALRESDDRSDFRSGDADLDRFLHKYAGQNQFRHHLGTTYAAVEGNRVAGYATVAPGHIEIEQLSSDLRKRLPPYPLPILRLARLAVDDSLRGRGVGRQLLRFVLDPAVRLAGDFGCLGVVVDAKPEAVSFYEQFGFAPLEVIEGHSEARPPATAMFLTLSEIKAAVCSRNSTMFWNQRLAV